MILNFPRTQYVDINGIVGQCDHILSEANEALDSALAPDINHTAMEVMDALHSCETALRILQEKHGINLNEVERAVLAKNKARGYYK
jgi:hypothetical protein